jgi:ferric-dicitrate binding protein FerR (iron transport regulator)
MNSFSAYDNIPWELVAISLAGDSTEEETRQLQQWISLSSGNKEQYEQLLRIWTEDIDDYKNYGEADELMAWTALEKRLMPGEEEQDKAPVIRMSVNQRIIRWAAVAAIFLVMAGVGYWYFVGRASSVVFATANNEQKKISLPDGSTIVLQSKTRIQLSRGFNNKNRTVELLTGQASFDVQHKEDIPFIVNMDVVSVRDIGTSFTIQKEEDSIKVDVASGKVAFIKNSSGETQDLTAGISLTYFVQKNSFGPVSSTGTVDYSNRNYLGFHAMPLQEVLSVLQKEYGKTIRLDDSSFVQKKLTINLDRESFDSAIKVICTMFNFQVVMKDSTFVLARKDKNQK